MSIPTLWIGCDPGCRHTGLIVRQRDACLYADVLHREDDGDLPDAAYLDRVVSEIASLSSLAVGPIRIAVEGVKAPSSHVGGTVQITNVTGLLGTALVLGAVLVMYPAAVVVPPGGHGTAPLPTYPSKLVGDREKRGAGVLQHARSAWDIAGAGPTFERLRTAK